LEFFAGDQLAGALQKGLENLKGLHLELEADAVLVQFAGGQVGFKVAETDDPVG